MNNDVLNMNRLGRYLVTDIRNAVARFGISLLVIATISLTGYLLTGCMSLFTGNGWHSMGVIGRFFLFGISTVIILVASPARIYGFITDKKEGSSYLTVPVSGFEKTVSMVLVSCIIVPLAFFAIYLLLDQIVCLLDHSCGDSILMILGERRVNLANALSDEFKDMDFYFPKALTALSNPFLYMDDIAEVCLIFLLGALIFKSSKPAKTIGCLILISIAFSMIATPIFTYGVLDADKFRELTASGNITPDELFDMFPVMSWMMKHPVLVDTISDTLVNVGLFIAIYFRVKRIKH